MNQDKTYQIANQHWTHDQLVNHFKIPEDALVEGCNLIHKGQHDELKRLRFMHFMSSFPADGFSGKSNNKIWDSFFSSGDTDWVEVFNPEFITDERLRECGFGPTQSKQFLKEFHEEYKAKGIPLHKIVRSLSIDGCGTSTSREFAKALAGVQYSFESKTKSVIDELWSLKPRITKVCDTLKQWGYQIILPVNDAETPIGVKFMLTGSPKSAGWKTKALWKAQLTSGSEVGKLKDADMLITDDLESTSSKMKLAQKLGIQIVTYTDAINLING